jgi:acyl-CoA thioester hydrolase
MTALERPAAPARAVGPGGAHRFRLRVYWEDTDAAGIVYYANYLRFIERARSELVREAGIDQRALQAGPGLSFQVRRCEVDYLAPARLDDVIEVETAVDSLGGASIDMLQTVRREGAELVRARVRVACVDRDGRPRRLPAPVRQAMAEFVAGKGEG